MSVCTIVYSLLSMIQPSSQEVMSVCIYYSIFSTINDSTKLPGDGWLPVLVLLYLYICIYSAH